jgi:hypothetical protein
MYLIQDDYGTRQTAWTMADAMDWLRFCSPHAWISNRLTGRVLRVRTLA